MRKPSPNSNDDVDYRYLTPGAFKVLSTNEIPPDPPSAPLPYRLTPNSKRKKNLSFAILAEPGDRGGSRSPSPTSGRVSPFRGRGFNPAGSRHASPAPSPPPEDDRIASNRSRIPQLQKRGNGANGSVFGEQITDYKSAPNKRKLTNQLSQSLTDVSTKVSKKPPPSPRKAPSYKNFQTLSPIVGSSPEPSQSQSSPTSRIPRTHRSQPSSRLPSPIRKQPPQPARASRSVSRIPSRNASRETSPMKTDTTKISVRDRYKNVQAKINSFSKPKVPPKPIVDNNDKPELQRKDSVINRTNSKSNLVSRTGSRNNLNTSRNNLSNSRNNLNNNEGGVGSRTNGSPTKNYPSTSKNNSNGSSKTFSRADSRSNLSSTTIKKDDSGTADSKINNSNNNDSNKNHSNNHNSNKNNSNDNNSNKNNNANENKNNNSHPTTNGNDNNNMTTTNTNNNKDSNKEAEADATKPPDANLLSSAEVVSNTTTTVTQPLKIEAKIETKPNGGISPMVDGRILSATSVSNAMNKMNDTVIDSKTLMKDHVKISPAASIIAMNAESKLADTRTLQKSASIDSKTSADRALDTKNATTVLPSLPPDNQGNKMNHNHMTTTGIISARVLEQHVQNNMSKLISPEHSMGNSLQKSANERIKEARTLVASDVKPIKILVKERPMDADVQSGNIGMHAANGLTSERPGLPPSQASNEAPPQQNEEPGKTNICTRFFRNKTQNCCFACCQKFKKTKTATVEQEEKKKKPSCFSCCKKKSDVTINIENSDESPKFWDRLKFWKNGKVADTTGCFPTRRRNSWSGKKTSFDESAGKPPGRCTRDCCRGVLRKMFCLNCCKKKKPITRENSMSRRASMMSKKKSLTPSSVATGTAPIEDHSPKLDMSLVEHQSHMKGAIPVLPISLAWFCCVMNCIAPGTGTVLSGLFCLCLGIPRFSQKDGIRPRIGAFLIDLFIGIGQCFTVLFCLVGWGWSIWWGVIMVKIAKKHQKIKVMEEQAAKEEEARVQNEKTGNNHRDPERGT